MSRSHRGPNAERPHLETGAPARVHPQSVRGPPKSLVRRTKRPAGLGRTPRASERWRRRASRRPRGHPAEGRDVDVPAAAPKPCVLCALCRYYVEGPAPAQGLLRVRRLARPLARRGRETDVRVRAGVPQVRCALCPSPPSTTCFTRPSRVRVHTRWERPSPARSRACVSN